MNQNLDYDAIKSLRDDLARNGYAGSAEDLLRSVQRASTSYEARRFWLLMGFPAKRLHKHPLYQWLTSLAAHFEDVTYLTGTVGYFTVMLSKRVAEEAVQGAPVESATVTMRDINGRLEVFVRYYDATQPDFRRSQTFYMTRSF